MSRTEDRQCKFCKNTFSVSVTNSKRILCENKKCADGWHKHLMDTRNEKVARICATCEKPFIPHTRRGSCCSEECTKSLILKNNRERYCENKEKYLEGYKRYVEKNREKRNKYSLEWHRRWRANNPRKYKAQNNEKRFGGLWTASMDRYCYSCKLCGSKDMLVVHHIDEIPENNVLSNLVVLCRSCHMKIHDVHNH